MWYKIMYKWASFIKFCENMDRASTPAPIWPCFLGIYRGIFHAGEFNPLSASLVHKKMKSKMRIFSFNYFHQVDENRLKLTLTKTKKAYAIWGDEYNESYSIIIKGSMVIETMVPIYWLIIWDTTICHTCCMASKLLGAAKEAEYFFTWF